MNEVQTESLKATSELLGSFMELCRSSGTEMGYSLVSGSCRLNLAVIFDAARHCTVIPKIDRFLRRPVRQPIFD
jgi:hypothetical protein